MSYQYIKLKEVFKLIVIINVNLFLDIQEVAILSATIGSLSIYSFTTEFINRHKKK